MRTGKNMVKVVLFYIFVAVLLTAVIAFAMHQETENKADSLSGEYNCGYYTLRLNKGNMVLIRNAKVVVDTAYKVAEKSGLTRLLPEKDWFVDGAFYDIAFMEQNGTVYLKTTAYGNESLYYPMIKAEGVSYYGEDD